MPQDNEKIKRVIKKVVDNSNNLELAILKDTTDINDKVDTLGDKIAEPKDVNLNIEGAAKVIIRGKDGIDGENGKDGEKGEKGDKGDDGYTPIKGVDYFDGIDGKDGRDGIDGLDGKDGKDGIDGKDGSPDTREQIIEKINSGGESKIDFSQIYGFDFLTRTEVQTELARITSMRGGIGQIEAFNSTGKIGSGSALKFIGSGVNSVTSDGHTVTVNITGGAGGGSWGSITGTLSDQTDLQTALDAKASLSGATFTGNVSLGANQLTVHNIRPDATDGLLFESLNGTDIGLLGIANTANATWYGSHNFSGGVNPTIDNGVNLVGITVTQNDITNNKNGINVVNAGTGNGIFVDANGNTGVIDGSSGAILIDNTGNTGIGMQIYSNQASPDGLAALLYLKVDNTAFAQPALYIVHDGTAGGAAHIRLDGVTPQIEMVETDQIGTDGSGKFEIGVNGDIFYVSGRNSTNTSFEDTIKIDRQANGGGIRFYGSTSGYTKIKASATAGTTTITMPATTGTMALVTGTSDAITVGTIELGHSSDTTISRSSAGVIAVEGVVVPTISSSNTLTNKTINGDNNTITNINRLNAKMVGSGVIAETYDRSTSSSSSVAVSQTIYFVLIGLLKGDVVTNLSVGTTTVSTGATTNAYLALYDTSGNRLAVSSDQTTALDSVGIHTVAMGTPYTVTTSGAYYVAILVNNAGTPPTFGRNNSNSTMTAGVGAGSRLAGTQTGQTTMPTTATIGTGAPIAYWIGVS